MRACAAIVSLLVMTACGGARATTASGGSGALDATAFLLRVGATRTDMLTPPDGTIDELEAARAAARGPERRAVLLALARAHMLAAGASDDRETRRHRSAAERFATAAASGSRDDDVQARSDFVELWLAYRAEDRSAAGRAERFTRRHAQSGELALLGWVIRGEIAFGAERWQDAIDAYRYVLGQLGHPLYAFALYRTAESQQRAGRSEDARQALTEVALLGCARDTDEPTRDVALHAARELGVGARRDEAGIERPASCPERTSGGEARGGGWTPEE